MCSGTMLFLNQRNVQPVASVAVDESSNPTYSAKTQKNLSNTFIVQDFEVIGHQNRSTVRHNGFL